MSSQSATASDDAIATFFTFFSVTSFFAFFFGPPFFAFFAFFLLAPN